MADKENSDWVDGYVATIENNDGSRFCNGSFFLKSEPHVSEQQARDWADAFDDTKIGDIERRYCHKSRIVN